MSRWAKWSHGTQTKLGLSSFMQLQEQATPIPGDPKEIAQQNGWVAKEYGWYEDSTGAIVARAVKGQMYVYDTDQRQQKPLDTGNPTGSGVQTPAERARAMGLQSNGKGGYIDPKTNKVAARTVNNELVFYDNGPGGGAVADGSGGRALTSSAPSWQDPISGLILVPPAQPETPQERVMVPDPVPASSPDGFDAYITKARADEYKKEKARREAEADFNQQAQVMQSLTSLNNEYQKIEQTIQKAEANLQNGKIDQDRFNTIAEINNNHKSRLEEYANKINSEQIEDQEVLQRKSDAMAGVARNEYALDMVNDKWNKFTKTKQYTTAGPEQQERFRESFERQAKPHLDKHNQEIEKYNKLYQEAEKTEQFFKDTMFIRGAQIDPKYDLDQQGEEYGSGMYGTVINPGDGNVIKTGDIDYNEVQTMIKLYGTGVAPRIVKYNFSNGRDGKLAMTMAQGKPIVQIDFNEVSDTEVANQYIRKLARMHQLGISHGDLHGNNVIYDEETNEVTLIDFGRSQESYTRAVLEAVATISGKNAKMSLDSFSYEDNPVRIKLNNNLKRMKNFLKLQGYYGNLDAGTEWVNDKRDWVDEQKWERNGYTLSYDDLNDEDLGHVPMDAEDLYVEEINNDTAKQALEILYEGFTD